jgi:monofunctional biosynthetic peptidoglycan transglycosylase
MTPPADETDLRTDRDDAFRPPRFAEPADRPAPKRERTTGGFRRGLRRLRLATTIAVVVVAALPMAGLALWSTVPPVSMPMVARWITGAPVTRFWRPIEEIDRDLVASVIASEDNDFCNHAGVDWDELRQVVSTAGGPRRGASTITMQLAKNLFLWSGRSYLRKALEIPLALLVDAVWSKRRIMEAYLNVAEWGPNGEFGIEAGTRRALGKSADRLAASEAALMTAMLPNPHLRDARRPTTNLRRVAGIVRTRAAGSPEFTACLEK